MLPDKSRLSETLALVDQMLHERRFSELEELSGGRRLTAEEIERALDDYPEALTARPAYELEDGDIVHVTQGVPAQWSVYLHLWRREGGRSDLTAELTITDSDAGLYHVEIDGIHVL